MFINPLLAIDFYKVDHRRQYPKGTTEIYSNFTPRYVKHNDNITLSFDNKIVVFGIQYLIKHVLVDCWDNFFFCRPRAQVVNEYKSIVEKALNIKDFDCSHIEALHDLGYLPIRIKALSEGVRVPIGIPILTIVNTHPDFYWLPNYLETIISATLWKPITSATIAYEFKKLMNYYAEQNCDNKLHVPYQCHDFSFRGMSGYEDACVSGAAHLTSFKGTDCVPAIEWLNYYYLGNSLELIGSSVPATEHSVMCCNGKEGEFETIKRLITEVYPTGIVSIVADSYNLWTVLTDYLPRLKEEILARDGKVVIRPDSGDPIDIICGTIDYNGEYKGCLDILWGIFGGSINSKGYKELNPKIGLIYGDGITNLVASEMLQIMNRKNFAANNIVFGIGSYTYQYVTRDIFGFAMKTTSAVINGERKAIYKNPITAKGTKKSAKGLLMVDVDENCDFVLKQDVTEPEEKEGLLWEVFADGKVRGQFKLRGIRSSLFVESLEEID